MSKRDEKHWTTCFDLGNNLAIDIINNLSKKVRKDEPKPNRANTFGAIMAGVASCLLYSGHRELERMLLESSQELDVSDQWLSMVVTKVLEQFQADKVPVEGKFIIGRKK